MTYFKTLCLHFNYEITRELGIATAFLVLIFEASAEQLRDADQMLYC
jgi:hypothetical protein